MRSLRHPTPEDLELLLIHEESRKVIRTGHISYYGQFYRGPDQYIGAGSGLSCKGKPWASSAGSRSLQLTRSKRTI